MGFIDLVMGSESYLFLAIIVVLVVLGVFLILFFRMFVNKVILKRFRKKEKFIQKTEGIFIIVMILIVLDVMLQRAIYQEEIMFRILRTLIVIMFTYFVIEIADLLIEVWGRHMTHKKGMEFGEEVLPVAHGVMKVLLFFVAFIIILQLWGVQVLTLLASMGVVGIILGFALKDSLSNVFGGISLIFDRTFKVGDVIQVEGGDVGEVVLINLRSTRILTYENKIVSIPNSVLANSKILNFSQPTNVLMINIEFGVAYGSDPEEVKRAVLSEVKKVTGVLSFPHPDVKMLKMNEYSLDFRLEVFKSFETLQTLELFKDMLTENLYNILKRRKIQIPYPTRVSVVVPYEKKELKRVLKKKDHFLKGKL
ncbi:MAG: mechanosensitive ion channel family protein [Nanoarchaeota archaeon]